MFLSGFRVWYGCGTQRGTCPGPGEVVVEGRGRDAGFFIKTSVRTFLKVYMELGSYFLFLQEQIKDIITSSSSSNHHHHHHPVTPTRALDPVACGARTRAQPYIGFCHPRLVQAFPSGRTGQGYCVLTAQVITPHARVESQRGELRKVRTG